MGVGQLELGGRRRAGSGAPCPPGAARPSRRRRGARRGRARGPRRRRSARPAAPGCSRRPGRAAPGSPARWPGRRRPASCSTARSTPSVPAQPGRRRPATAGRKRARSTAGTGSTSARSAARDRRRSVRSTSASQKSLPWTPPPDSIGRSSPSTTRPAADQAAQGVGDDRRPEPEPRGDVGGRERPVGAGVAARPGRPAGRAPARGRPRARPPAGRRRARRAAGRRPRSPPSAPRRRPGPGSAGGRSRGRPASVDLLGVGALDAPVHDGLGAAARRAPGPGRPRPRPTRQRAARRSALELGLGAARRRRGRAGRAARRPRRGRAARPAGVGSSDEGGGAPLGQRRVALVEELRDVAEHQAAGERRGLSASRPRPAAPARDPIRRISSTSPGTSKTSWTHSRTVSRMIGKDGVLAGDLEQLGGPLPLLPQRPGAGPAGAAAAAGPARRTRGTATRTAPSRRSRS